MAHFLGIRYSGVWRHRDRAGLVEYNRTAWPLMLQNSELFAQTKGNRWGFGSGSDLFGTSSEVLEIWRLCLEVCGKYKTKKIWQRNREHKGSSMGNKEGGCIENIGIADCQACGEREYLSAALALPTTLPSLRPNRVGLGLYCMTKLVE